MTERVQQACDIAVALACEHATDPAILEVTLHLGKLEGMWAQLFARREKLIAQYTATVTTAWRQLIRPRLFRDGLHTLRQQLGLTEATTDQQERDEEIKAAALAAARSMLQGLPLTPGWAQVRQSLRDALAAGQAEGILGAVAIAAERAGRDGLDWDAGFARAYQQLERLDTLWSQAETWLSRLVERAVVDLARALAAKATAGAGYDDMLDASSEELDGDDVDAVDFTTDWAMTTAMGTGAMGLYQLQNLLAVNWITAGDGRVCAACQANEDSSPWPLDAAPECPAHPRCRCVLDAGLDLSGFADWFTS
jgi:hypothetical protein